MIGKVSSQRIIATETSHVEKQPEAAAPEKEALVAERPSRESVEQTAAARKNEMAITGSTQRAMLSAQLQTPDLGKQKAQDVAVKSPEPPQIKGADSPRTLQLGDKGKEVSDLQYDLLVWQVQNHLPPNVGTNGVFTEDTQRALRQFQLAHGLLADGKADGNTMMRLKLETDRNFQNLDDGVKQSIRFNMDQFKDNPAAQGNLLKLSTDKQFQLLSKDSQQSAISGFLARPESKEHLKVIQDAALDVAILEKQKTLDHLPESTRSMLISTIFKKAEVTNYGTYGVYTAEDSAELRERILDLAKDPEFGRLTADQQALVLDGVSRNPTPEIAERMKDILNSPGYKNMNPKMRDHVIRLANENALSCLTNRNERGPLESADQLIGLDSLLRDPKFLSAPEDEQWAQLNAFKVGPRGSAGVNIL